MAWGPRDQLSKEEPSRKQREWLQNGDNIQWCLRGLLHMGLSLNAGSGTLLTVGFGASSMTIVSFIILISNIKMIVMIEHLPHNCYED